MSEVLASESTEQETSERIVTVEDLSVSFRGSVAVKGVSFTIDRGETLALVGESGSGKSVSSLAVMGLIPSPPGVVGGTSVRFDGRELLGLPDAELRKLRGLQAYLYAEGWAGSEPHQLEHTIEHALAGRIELS